MIEKTLKTDRGEIYYYIKRNIGGKGTIVFSHGLTADHTLFDMQTEYFAKDYNVISWDMPLHGKSIPYKDFSLANAAKDLMNILNEEHLSKVILAAQSGGGYVAQQFIKMYPQNAVAFISIDSTPLEQSYYGKEVFYIKHFADIAKLYPWGVYLKASVNSAAYTKESRESFSEALSRLGKNGMLVATDAFYNSFLDFYGEPLNIDIPVLLVLGEFDKTGYVKKYNEAWAQATGYHLAIIKNAAHNSNYDNYEQFNETMKTFLNENSL